MYKLYVSQTHKYQNVSLDFSKPIDSPWVPRVSEEIISHDFRGIIEKINYVYIVEPRVYVSLKDYEENEIISGISLQNKVVKYSLVMAYVEGTAYALRDTIYEKASSVSKEIEFDGKAFDEKFLPKGEKSFYDT